MKGLILKDLMGLKKFSKNYLIFILFYAVIGLFSNMYALFSGFIMVFAFMLPITAVSFDERSKWDSYALTMPISRKDIVLSRYLLGLIFAGAAVVICFVYTLITSGENFGTSLLLSGAFFLVGMLFFSIIFPILLKVGVEKGRLTMIIIFLLPTVIIMTLSKIGFDFSKPSEQTLMTIAWIAPFVVIAIFVASIFLSFRIYSKKEM